MARHTAESLLISALINTGDTAAHVPYGVLSQHFTGYRVEFDWVVSYGERFGRAPSPAELTLQFPDFPLNSEQTEVRWTCQEVVEQASARSLSRALVKSSLLLQSGDITGAFKAIEGQTLQTVAKKPTNMLVDPDFLNDYDEELETIPVPWPTLQRATDGIGKGELWYFAARPGQGKTSTSLYTAVMACLSGFRVAMYSLEMTRKQVQTRAHAIMAHELGIEVSQRDLASRRYDRLMYRKLLDQIEELMAERDGFLHIHTPADGMVTPAVIDANAAEYDLIVVDYIGLMCDDSGKPAVDDWRILASISNRFKQIALSHDVGFLVPSQINRSGVDARSRPPRIDKLAGSDALAQDGDVVVTMAQMSPDAQAFSLEKNRHGAGGQRWFSYYGPDIGDFHEIPRDEAEELREEHYARIDD